MLSDEDARVRETIGATLVQLTARLFFAEDWPGVGEAEVQRLSRRTIDESTFFSRSGQDALIAVVERKAAFLTGQASAVSWCSGSKTEDLNEQHLHVPRFGDEALRSFPSLIVPLFCLKPKVQPLAADSHAGGVSSQLAGQVLHHWLLQRAAYAGWSERPARGRAPGQPQGRRPAAHLRL